MAQTTHTAKYKTIRGSKGLVRIYGKHAFTTTGLTVSISAKINHMLFGSLVAIGPTLTSTSVQDVIYWSTATITPATNTIAVVRGYDDSKSGMEFFYEIIGR